MTLSIVAHLLGFSELVEESDDLALDLVFVVYLAWRLTLGRREVRTPCGGNDFVEEDLATLGFVLTTLSLYLYWYRPICGLLYLLL